MVGAQVLGIDYSQRVTFLEAQLVCLHNTCTTHTHTTQHTHIHTHSTTHTYSIVHKYTYIAGWGVTCTHTSHAGKGDTVILYGPNLLYVRSYYEGEGVGIDSIFSVNPTFLLHHISLVTLSSTLGTLSITLYMYVYTTL